MAVSRGKGRVEDIGFEESGVEVLGTVVVECIAQLDEAYAEF